MFNSRLTTMEYRAVARSMDRHRRHFSIRPFNAYLSGSLCRTFRLHFVVTPALFLASNSYSLSRSLSWNFNGPSIWAGLLTLVVLEIVLGIDNLVFIAILADKLPPKQRDKARLLGLSLALIMRLGLLSLISWMVTLTKPLFTVMDFSFSDAT